MAVEFPGLAELIGRLRVRHGSIDAEIAARLKATVAARACGPPLDERDRVAGITIGFVRGGVQIFANTAESRRAGYIAGLKTALASYLEARLQAARAARVPGTIGGLPSD